MNNDNRFGGNGLPMLAQPLSVADQLAIELEIARNKTGIVSRVLHQYRESNSAKALNATRRKHEAFDAAVKSTTELLNSHSDMEAARMRARVQAELGPLVYQVVREEAMIALQTRLSRAEEGSLIAQRDVASAKNSLEATREFKALNFAIGSARKKATIAETLEALPSEEAESSAGGRKFELGDALEHRANLRANGVDVPEWLNAMIEQLRNDELDIVAE